MLAVAFSLDGRLGAASGGDSRASGGSYAITIWDTTTRQLMQTLEGHQQDVVDLAFTHDGTRLISSNSDQSIAIWEIATGNRLLTLDLGVFSAFLPFDISPDDQTLVAGTLDGTLFGWNLSTGVPLAESLSGHTRDVTAVAFSPSGDMLASASLDGSIRLWDSTSWQPIRVLDSIDSEFSALTFTSDGSTLISGGRDSIVRLWDVESGLLDNRVIELTDEITSLSISTDGLTLLTAIYGNDLQLWDVPTLRPIGGPLLGHDNLATAAIISPEADYVISGGADRHVFLWRTSLGAWKDLACQIANRDFTALETERYPSLTQYRPDCLLP